MITPDTPAMKPPKGSEPNFINPPSHDKANVILHTICLTLTTLFVMMRLYTRHYISQWIGWDDCKSTYNNRDLSIADSVDF